ncbi:MAG: hypothetical protein JNG88_09850 [Phycisphaerales bacterium]|nr:hypothetical protein [Phycisphaerales bacterium]
MLLCAGGLVAIILVAAALRLFALGLGPPGLNQDEAANAWNAYCLLKTGVDQVGQPWPIFHTRALGENRSTLFIYLLMPFQAVLGLSPLSTRAAAPVFGVATVGLMYYVASRWFGRRVGLLAAGLLAINPWHIQHCRWGHESSIVPFLVILPIALLVRARLLGHPCRGASVDAPNSPRDDARAGWALAGGLSAGVACYGYPSVRIFLPVFLALAAIVAHRDWRVRWNLRRGRHACIAAAGGFFAMFAPLAVTHLVDPEINKRAEMTKVWRSQDGAIERIGKVVERYAMHFDPAFLFVRGDSWEVFSPPGGGMFLWFTLPLMLGGVVAMAHRWWSMRNNAAPAVGIDFARSLALLAVFTLTYPVGDMLSGHPSAHALRSLPGVIPLNMLAALGGVWMWDALRSRSRAAAIAASGAIALAAIGESALDNSRRMGEYNRRPRVYHDFFVDLLEACDFVRPRLAQADVVFIGDTGMPYAYVVTLVGLQYDPHRWLIEPRDWERSGWDTYRRFGKLRFLSQESVVHELAQLRLASDGRRALLIVRPEQYGQRAPLLEIKRPDGQAVLWVCEEILGRERVR